VQTADSIMIAQDSYKLVMEQFIAPIDCDAAQTLAHCVA